MPIVTVEGEKSFEVEAGKKLVLGLEDNGIDVLHRCGGNAHCTTCRVEIVEGNVPAQTEMEREALAEAWHAALAVAGDRRGGALQRGCCFRPARAAPG